MLPFCVWTESALCDVSWGCGPLGYLNWLTHGWQLGLAVGWELGPFFSPCCHFMGFGLFTAWWLDAEGEWSSEGESETSEWKKENSSHPPASPRTLLLPHSIGQGSHWTGKRSANSTRGAAPLELGRNCWGYVWRLATTLCWLEFILSLKFWKPPKISSMF